MTPNTATRWVIGLTVFGVTCATLAEFPSTEPLAVALVWAAAMAVTVTYGEQALTEIQRVTT